MALQVWMPLQGTLDNLGCGIVTQTSSAAAVFKANGKLGGSCLNIKTQVVFSCPQIANKTSFSIAFWGKVDTNTSLTGDWVDIIGFNDQKSDNSSNGQLRWETCYTYNTASRGISGHDNATYAITNGDIGLASASKDVWSHITLTVGSDVRVYFNGVLNTILTATGGHLTGTFWFGQTNAIEGSLSDVRVYDETLSAKQVKEIYKSLVLHYKLDNNGYCGNNLFKRSALRPKDREYGFAANGNTDFETYSLQTYNAAVHTVTLNAQGIYEDSIALTNNLNLGICFARSAEAIDLDPTSYYTISCEALCTNGSAHLDIGLSYYNGSGFIWRGGTNAQYFNAANTWQKFKLTFKPDADTVGINYCITCNCGGNNTLKLRNCKMEKGTVATPWTFEQSELDELNTLANGNKIFDSSGYNNNGYIKNPSTTGQITKITPRYQAATHIVSGQTIMSDKSSSAILPRYEVTYSIWFKTTNPGWRFISCTEGGGFNIETNGNYFHAIIYIAGTGYVSVNSTTQYSTLANQWHMVTATYKAGVMTIYIDGIQEAMASVANNLISYPGSTPLTLGGEAQGLNTPANTDYVGDLSDCRIYATALSAADVKELYETSMIVDSSGNILPRILTS